jgi:exodeoxyribonuclease VII large subunit
MNEIKMNTHNLFQEKYWSVTELTRHIKKILENDNAIQVIWVSGEISNIAHPNSGHLYFTLKDRNCSLRCVMWRSDVNRLSRLPNDGEAIDIHGKVSVYEAGGQYQFYVDKIQSAGEGELYKEFLILKQKLENEGLFSEEIKRSIPKWPHSIGVVTSPTGAAFRDIINTISRRYPLAEVMISPSQVQGIEAPQSIVEAIHKLNYHAKTDVIIVARGGGSIEDLWAFNSEIVARAIANSTIPIICGIGHETDFTIADFVCDLRAPTPTAAAELATPNREEQIEYLFDLRENLNGEIKKIMSIEKQSLNLNCQSLRSQNPLMMVQSNSQKIDTLIQNMEKQTNHNIVIKKTYLYGVNQKLISLSPEKILQRGYTIVTKEDGKIARSINQVKDHDHLNIIFIDGKAKVQVGETTQNNDLTLSKQKIG